MSWTVPTPTLPDDGPWTGLEERPQLQVFLDWQRRDLLNICAGLTGEQLVQASMPPSTLTLLGLIRHLTKVERQWFRQRVAGEDVPLPFDPALGKDADFEQLDPAQAPEAVEALQAEWALCDAVAATFPLDAEAESKGDTLSLRSVYLHMIEEYARHNGHADLLRQAIDGTTGR